MLENVEQNSENSVLPNLDHVMRKSMQIIAEKRAGKDFRLAPSIHLVLRTL